MTSLLLIRHAHADWSPDEMRPLSEKGERDASRLAEQLSTLPITAIYSSPYKRALDTVLPLAGLVDLPVQELPGLRERTIGSFGRVSFDEAVATTWRDFDVAYPGGESNRAAQHRGVSVIRTLAGRHPQDLIVAGTHGNMLALILNAFDAHVDFDFWRTLEFPDVLRLDFESPGKSTYHRPFSRPV